MEYLTIKELSAKYNYNETLIYKAVKKGQIPFLMRSVEIQKRKGGNMQGQIIVINENHFKIFMLCREFSNNNSQEIFNYFDSIIEKIKK